ncbi:MAG: dihydrofolate reductase family protein [Anaerolineae bacterium]|nr:dihydrofolate reductase family protein [Anaerolineae bacterium]
MRNIILLMHISLDGFVAPLDGSLDWAVMDDGLTNDVDALVATADTAIYGRYTYEGMRDYWTTVPSNPDATPHERNYAEWVENAHKVVFSTTLESADWNNSRLIKTNIVEEMTKLKAQTGKDMMIFGSPRLTHSFMALDLIDEYRLMINPILLGAGTPLYKAGYPKTHLKRTFTKTYDCGVVGVHYVVNRG